MTEKGTDNIAVSECLSALDSAGIEYVKLDHGSAETMELCSGIGSEYGARHCKNLFLANRSGRVFCLLLMDADKPYSAGDVSKKLGLPRMGFGSPEQLFEVLGLRPGCVGILGTLNPCAKEAYSEGRLRIAVDRSLLERERICVHPNDPKSSLVIKSADILRIIALNGMECTVIDV